MADARGRTKETLTMTTDYPTAASPSPVLSRLRLALVLICALLGLNVLAGEARREPQRRIIQHHLLELRGGRPSGPVDLLPLSEPGVSEAARNVIFQAPEGIFGNPYAITHCTSSDFALDQCPSDSQAGLITVYANYEGEPTILLGHRPDIQRRAARRTDGAARLHRPHPQHPDQHPGGRPHRRLTTGCVHGAGDQPDRHRWRAPT